MRPTAVEWIAYESLVVGGAPLPPAPFLSVLVASGRRKLAQFGLVDSASQMSCLPPWLADALGLELEGPMREVRVLGGTTNVRSAFCDLRVPTSFGILTFRWAEFAVPIGGQRGGIVILGQNPLFGEVEIRFQSWLGRFGLQRRIGDLAFVPATAGRPPPGQPTGA